MKINFKCKTKLILTNLEFDKLHSMTKNMQNWKRIANLGNSLKYINWKRQNEEVIDQILNHTVSSFPQLKWDDDLAEDFVYNCLFRNEFKLNTFGKNNFGLGDSANLVEYVNIVNDFLTETPNTCMCKLHYIYVSSWLS